MALTQADKPMGLIEAILKDVMAILQEILQNEGLSQEEAKLQIDSYQARFSQE